MLTFQVSNTSVLLTKPKCAELLLRITVYNDPKTTTKNNSVTFFSGCDSRGLDFPVALYSDNKIVTTLQSDWV